MRPLWLMSRRASGGGLSLASRRCVHVVRLPSTGEWHCHWHWPWPWQWPRHPLASLLLPPPAAVWAIRGEAVKPKAMALVKIKKDGEDKVMDTDGSPRGQEEHEEDEDDWL